MTRLTFLLLPVLMILAPFAAAQDYASPLTIASGENVHSFNVDIADEPSEVQLGLMNRAEMAADAGMIFDFGAPREASMWMKNTLIPLDMLFFTSDGTIVAIARNTTPGSLRTVNPGMPVKGVLELNANRAAQLGIQPGDTVQHEILGNLE